MALISYARAKGYMSHWVHFAAKTKLEAFLLIENIKENAVNDWNSLMTSFPILNLKLFNNVRGFAP